MISHTTGITSRTWSSFWTVMYHSFKDENQKAIVKMIKTMVWDPECKYLHPSESTEASSSDEGMPQKFDTPSEADIMARVSSGYAHTRGENKHFKCYWAHGSIPYWSCWGNVMYEEAHHDHTSWCIPFDVASNGATHIMISASMTFTMSDQVKKKSTTQLHW